MVKKYIGSCLALFFGLSLLYGCVEEDFRFLVKLKGEVNSQSSVRSLVRIQLDEETLSTVASGAIPTGRNPLFTSLFNIAHYGIIIEKAVRRAEINDEAVENPIVGLPIDCPGRCRVKDVMVK